MTTIALYHETCEECGGLFDISHSKNVRGYFYDYSKYKCVECPYCKARFKIEWNSGDMYLITQEYYEQYVINEN